MQPGRVVVLVGLLAVVATAGNAVHAEAQDEPSLSIGADLEYRSRYLFSGIPFSTGSVMQAKLAFGYSGFTISALTNYDFDTSEINEADAWADYYHQFSENVGGYVGGAVYNFKGFKTVGEWDPTYEFFAGLSTSFPGNPALHYARDFELSDGGQIARLTLSHDVPINSVTISGAGNLVYNDNYYRVGSNISHLDISISATIQLGHFSVTPMISYQEAIADDFDDFWVGILNFHGDF